MSGLRSPMQLTTFFILMKSYLFLSNAIKTDIEDILIKVGSILNEENIDRIIVNGDFTGSQNEFMLSLKHEFEISLESWGKPSEEFMTNMIKQKDSLFEEMNLFRIKLGFVEYAQSRKTAVRGVDFFWDYINSFYKIKLLCGTGKLPIDYVMGCVDEFPNFNSFNNITSYLTKEERERFGDISLAKIENGIFYIPGIFDVQPNRSIIDLTRNQGVYYLQNKKGKYTITEKEGLTALNEIIDKGQQEVDTIMGALAISNPLQIIERHDGNVSDKLVVSHIPLGKLYGKIGSNKRIIAHGFDPGIGLDIKGNKVEEDEWLDELIINPTDIDKGVISVISVEGEKIKYIVHR